MSATSDGGRHRRLRRRPSDAADDAPLDLSRIQADINEEVRRRRASGDFPPGLERELDAVFARYAPAGVGDDFDAVMASAETQSFVHADVPTESRMAMAALRQTLRAQAHRLVRPVPDPAGHRLQRGDHPGREVARRPRRRPGDRDRPRRRAVAGGDPRSPPRPRPERVGGADRGRDDPRPRAGPAHRVRGGGRPPGPRRRRRRRLRGRAGGGAGRARPPRPVWTCGATTR